MLLTWLVACALFTAEEPSFIEYTVVRGDTLFEIARDHQVTVDQLRAWNQLEGDLIEVGQVLRIEPPAADAVPPDPLRQARVRRPRQSTPTSESSDASSLAMPAAKPCLAAPDGSALGDEGMVGSQGLSSQQVRQAMQGFLPNTLRCPDPESTWPEGTVLTEITVGCDGRVFEVQVVDDGGLDPKVVDCVADTLRYAPFPAHDLPDGYTFTQPVTYAP